MKKSRLRPYDISFLFFASLSCLCIAISVKNPALNTSFQKGVVEVIAPIALATEKPGEWGSSLAQSLDNHLSAVAENEDLKNENRMLRHYKAEVLKLRHENLELKYLMQLSKSVKGQPLATRLMMDGGSPFSRSSIVNVGEKEGVERGQQVVSEDGLVGRVVEVFPNSSRVLLITDYTFRMPIRILESRVQGIVRGTNGRYLELMLLEKEADVKENMTVVTSGAGGVFSENIPVGYIHKENGKTYVVPDVDFSTLGFVSIQRRQVDGILEKEKEEGVSDVESNES